VFDMLKLITLLLITLPALTIADPVDKSLIVELTLPKIDTHPYHKPFVAVWLEDEKRKPIQTIALWYDDAEWLKDLRQWWRKLGRNQHANGRLDGLSGATKKPGIYRIKWQGKTADKTVLVNIEVVREEGGRSYHRQRVNLLETAVYSIPAEHEFGLTKILVGKND